MKQVTSTDDSGRGGARNKHPWGTENRVIQFGSSLSTSIPSPSRCLVQVDDMAAMAHVSAAGFNLASMRVTRDALNPLAPPGRGIERIRKILRLVHHFAVAELHDAHCICWSSL